MVMAISVLRCRTSAQLSEVSRDSSHEKLPGHHVLSSTARAIQCWTYRIGCGHIMLPLLFVDGAGRQLSSPLQSHDTLHLEPMPASLIAGVRAYLGSCDDKMVQRYDLIMKHSAVVVVDDAVCIRACFPSLDLPPHFTSTLFSCIVRHTKLDPPTACRYAPA